MAEESQRQGQAVLPDAPFQGAPRQFRECRTLRLALRRRRHPRTREPLGSRQPRPGGQATVRHVGRPAQPRRATWGTTCSSTRRLTHDAYTARGLPAIPEEVSCAASRASMTTSAACSNYLENSGPAGQHDHHLHRRSGIHARANTTTSTNAGCTKSRCGCRLSFAIRHLVHSWQRLRRDHQQRRLRPDAAGHGRPICPGRHAGPQFPAHPRRARRPNDWRTATYYRYWMHMAHHDNPAHYGLRTAHYKLIFFYGLPLDAPGAVGDPTPPHWEFYDLEKDPNEMNNVYHDPAYAHVIQELKTELLRTKSQVGDTDEAYPHLMKVRESHWD